MYIGKKYRVNPQSFRHRIREPFGHFFNENHLMGIDPFDSSKFHAIYEPPTNVKEKEETYCLELMVPGFKRENIHISISGDCLLVEGDREDDVKEESQEYIHHEHTFNSFRREFFLNPNTDKEHIEAEFDNGMLKIFLHKLPVNKEEKKEVLID